MTRPRWWRPTPARLLRVTASTAAALLFVGPLLSVGASQAAAQTPPVEEPAKLPPIQVVVLVDESGSLGPDGVAAEKEAAQTIAQGAPSPDTTVTVVGFGSSNGTAGQTAAVTRCPPTKVDSAQARDALARCIGDVHARTEAEGNHTDHVSALRQAVGFLDAPEGTAKVVFLLTDGKLDVTDSPGYGRNLGPEARNDAARDQVPGLLADVTRRGGQVWPLGFGPELDTTALGGFATGEPCTPTEPRPAANVVANAPDVLTDAIIKAYRSAACVGADDIQKGPLPTADTLDLAVQIPPIASDSSILVYKRDARVQVTYLDPNGKPAQGTGADGSTFGFSGQGTATESLHITDPLPGTWTVRLQSTSDIPPQDVAATVLFQGAVNAVLTLSPPQPAAGQQVEAAMQVRARRAGITDPALLRGLTFAAVLTGPSVGPEQRATLTDDDGDGTFTAPFTLPTDARGDLTVTGTVTGVGIGGDERVVTTTVRTGPVDLEGQLRLTDSAGTVVPGDAVPGEASITNRSGQERRLRLQAVEPGPGTVVAVDPAVITVPASGTTTLPFSVRFAENTVVGGNQFVLQAVDDADPSSVVASQPVARQVTEKPLVAPWLLWTLVAAAVVAVLLLLLLLRRLAAGKKRRSVGGLRVELLRGGRSVSDLQPLDPRAQAFRFSLYDNGVTGPVLEHADPSSNTLVYELRREGGGLVLHPVADGDSPAIAPGGQRAVGGDAVLVVHDDRGSGGGPASDDGGYAYPPVNVGAGHGGEQPTATYPGSSYNQPPSYAEPPRRANPSGYGPPGGGGGADAGGYQDPSNPWQNQ